MWAHLANSIRSRFAKFIQWTELISVRKFFAAIRRISVIFAAAPVIVAAVTYLVDTPKRHQAMIADALTSIRAVKEQPYSAARQRALMLLNVNCVSATGLNLEHAELAGIDLRPCHRFDLSHAQMSGAVLKGAYLER